MDYNQQIVYLTNTIATLSEALTNHESQGCKRYEGKSCSCEPYRNQMEVAKIRRQEIEDANAELVDNDITRELEHANGL